MPRVVFSGVVSGVVAAGVVSTVSDVVSSSSFGSPHATSDRQRTRANNFRRLVGEGLAPAAVIGTNQTIRYAEVLAAARGYISSQPKSHLFLPENEI